MGGDDNRECREGGKDVQVGPVIPLWLGQVSAKSLDEDFVLVELEDDIGEPPGPLALVAFAVARRAAGGRAL